MKKETKSLFKILNLLEQIRDLFRLTAPDHKMNADQLKTLKNYLKNIKAEAETLEKFSYGFTK